MLHLKSHGQTSTDVLSHLWATYKSSNDQEFVTYITSIEDQVRDDDLEINYGGLMKKAQSKAERLMVSRNLNNISTTIGRGPFGVTPKLGHPRWRRAY